MKRRLHESKLQHNNVAAMRNVVFNYNSNSNGKGNDNSNSNSNSNNNYNRKDDASEIATKRINNKRQQIGDDNNAIAATAAAGIDYVADIERFSYNVKTTVTTVPQHQHQQIITTKKISPLSSSSSSLLKSSPTALAKFNRIIDATMSDTNAYEQQQHKHWMLNESNIVSNDSVKNTSALEKNGKIVICKDDNHIKRNDVHYLLKQLNSFSDIEEIDIVDMQQMQKYKQKQQQQLQPQLQQHEGMQATENTTTTITSKPTNISNVAKSKNQTEQYSPTAQSLVLKSPSSLSHRGIRRYASLHQTHETVPTMVVASLSQQLPPTQAEAQYYTTAATALGGADGATSVATAAHLLQQFDDYLFQSCHYLETNYFAANYRTAMVESSSHEFRPSTTTGTSASYSSHSSVHTFDLHETEPPSVICKAPPPSHLTPPTSPTLLASPPPPLLTPTEASLSPCHLSVAMFTMSHEMQDHPHYTYAIHAQQPPALAPPPRRFQMQTRLTSSGVQTELTASSLSTAATNSSSLAKSFTSVASAVSHPTSTSSSSSTEAARCRRKPLFKCCYTPIDRWRERRTAAATHKQQRAGSHAGVDATTKDVKTSSSAV